MLPLRELQAAMAAGVLGQDHAPLLPVVRADGIPFGQRLQVYRNNTLSSLTEALKETFTIVCQLVDERFFRYAAREFIGQHPPRAPRLSEYGAGFADFLAAFEPARHLRYLPHMARLEWAVNLAFHAPDAPNLEPARIALVPMDDYPNLVFKFHPSGQLLSSPYPIDRIWDAHQPGGDFGAGIDLGAGGCHLLIDRHRNDIRFLALDEAGFGFASALAAARPLQQAADAAAAVDPAFDLTNALAAHLTRGTFTDFIEPDSSREERS
ncbi:MAG: DNA-binding domain-containing protein [Dongiaceae bacterium]